MKPIKIVMMGGERVGKTSLLASLVDTMRNDCRVRNVMSLNNIPTEKNNLEILNRKISSLRNKISSTPIDKCFLIEDGKKTPHIVYYDIIISLPNNPTCKIWLQFIDIIGEGFIDGAKSNDEIAAIVKESDVFLVAIDTPFLMEATSSQCYLYNRVSGIQRFFAGLDDDDGKNAKLVLFVPIKCEKWAQENRIGEVKNKVKEVYKTPIQNLSGFKNIEMDIIPVQTCGSIVFVEQLEGKLCEIENKIYRCSPVDNGYYRIEDGSNKPANDSIRIIEDINGRRGKFRMPYSWFKLSSHDYRPYNCEQVVYLILLFTYSKRNFNNMLYAMLERIRQEQKHANFFRRIINRIYIASIYITIIIDILDGNSSNVALYSSVMNEKFSLLPSGVAKELIKTINQNLNIGVDGIQTIKKATLLEHVMLN